MYTLLQTEHENISFDHLIIFLICIVFFMLFVIQMTIFDFYKKPSIYELELLNEFKKSHGHCETKEETKCEEKSDNRNVYIYRDILYFIIYINIMYFCSIYLNDIINAIIGVIIISVIIYIKYSKNGI